MKIRPTKILVWLVLAGVAFALYWAFQPQPLPADFATVVRGPLQVTLDEEGQTRVRDRYVVSAPVDGRVLRIHHEPGDEVRRGSTVLASFLPASPAFLTTRSRAEAEAEVATATATVERARAQLDQALVERSRATAELERREKLHDAGLLADDRLEASRFRAEAAREAVTVAESDIAVAESELDRARTGLIEAAGSGQPGHSAISLPAPVSGVVLRRIQESESVVRAGEPLLEIADPEELEIVSDMLSTDAVRIRRGFPVLVEQWGGQRPLRGTVQRVEPYGFTKISALGVEEQRVNVIVDFDDAREAWRALGDGYRVEIRVVVWQEESVLKVTTSSLFRQNEDWAVYAVRSSEDGLAAELRVIEVGQRNPREAQVLGGLEEGEMVIEYPGDQIEDGVSVVDRSSAQS